MSRGCVPPDLLPSGRTKISENSQNVVNSHSKLSNLAFPNLLNSLKKVVFANHGTHKTSDTNTFSPRSLTKDVVRQYSLSIFKRPHSIITIKTIFYIFTIPIRRNHHFVAEAQSDSHSVQTALKARGSVIGRVPTRSIPTE